MSKIDLIKLYALTRRAFGDAHAERDVANMAAQLGTRIPPEPKPSRGGARKGAGRKPGSARQGKQRTWLISDEALAVLEAIPERQRGAWVAEAIIERAARDAVP